jgi:hypothetical protein
MMGTRLLAIRGVAQDALDHIAIAQTLLDTHVMTSGDQPRGRGSDKALEAAASKLKVIMSRCNDGLRSLGETEKDIADD